MKRILLMAFSFVFGISMLSAQNEADDNRDWEVSSSTTPERDDPTIDYTLDNYASFPDGKEALARFIAKNLTKTGELKGAVGRVMLLCDVKKDGTITPRKVTTSLNEACDNEAKRLVQSMPKWLPAKRDGKAVKSRVYVTVDFK